MVTYKQALSYVQPNFDLDDPINSVWRLRKETDNPADSISVMGSRKSLAIS